MVIRVSLKVRFIFNFESIFGKSFGVENVSDESKEKAVGLFKILEINFSQILACH